VVNGGVGNGGVGNLPPSAMPGEVVNGGVGNGGVGNLPPIDAKSLSKLDEKDRELALTFKLGQYRVTYAEGASVRREQDTKSQMVTTLKSGQLIDVIEMVQSADLLIAKIRTESGDDGWMSLLQLGARHLYDTFRFRDRP
jgi:hypothetical protein